MLYVDGLVGLVLLVVWIYGLFDVISTRDQGIRNLPKWAWFLLVLLLGPQLLCAGTVAWFVAGRPVGPARLLHRGDAGRASGQRPSSPPGASRSSRAARAGAGNPDDDAEFLDSLRARAEEQRRRAEAEHRQQDDPDPT